MNDAKKTWTYQEAMRVVPLVRKHLANLREQFVRVMHLHRQSKRAPTPEQRDTLRAEVQRYATASEASVLEIVQMGIVVYHKPWRGVALFPFQLRHRRQGAVVVRDAFFVYKDSRTSIDSWLRADDLARTNDLLGQERPVPDEWKRGGLGVLPMPDGLEDCP